MNRRNRSLAAPGPAGSTPPPPSQNAAAAHGPTLVLDDAGMTATQLYSEAARAAEAAQHVTKARPRVVVPPHIVEEALQMTTHNKVTAKNAWAVQLIEGMQASVGQALSDQEDQYAQFTRAAHLVEGGAKVWTQRVESTYLLSTQMVKRLLRNDTRNDDDDADNEDGDNPQPTQQRRKRKPLERTVADKAEEINLEGLPQLIAFNSGEATAAADAASIASRDVGQKGAMAAHGALFRAVTEKFDQGHAQGLLLNNAAIGSVGNLVLDRDFAADKSTTSGAAAPSTSVPRDRGTPAAGAPVDAVFPVVDLTTGVEVPAEELAKTSAAVLSTANLIEHTARTASNPRDEIPLVASRAPSVYSRMDSEMRRGVPDDDDDDDAGGYDDMGGDDWNDGPAGDDELAAQYADGDPGNDTHYTARNASRMGSVARHVVSGAGDMDAVDAQFNAALGGSVCALASEDPGSWVPMSQQPSTGAFGQSSSKLLDGIRRQCAVNPGSQTAADGNAPKKHRRDKKSVRFIGAEGADATAGGSAVLDTSEAALQIDESVLASARNRTASLTPLGKRLFTDRSNTVDPRAYTDPAFCTQRARENRLLLPETLYEALPRWCGATDASVPPTVEGFFQPFGIDTAQWNLLKKTVRGALGTTMHSAAAGGASTLYGAEPELPPDMPLDVFDEPDYGDDGGDAMRGDDGGMFAHIPEFAQPGADDDDDGAALELGGEDGLAEFETPDGGVQLLPAPEQIKALKVQHATAPTMVDVVALRQVMWKRVKQLVARRGGQFNQTMFSDVITSMLPDVPTIARDGNLSPAFFFFSLLFLTNEQGLDLNQIVSEEQLNAAMRGEPVPGIDDNAIGASDVDGDEGDSDDDASYLTKAAAQAAEAQRERKKARAAPDAGGVVRRVGVDVAIRVPKREPAMA